MLQNYLFGAKEQESSRQRLVKDARGLEKMLNDNDRLFNMIESPELIEYSIHERSALQCRYHHVLRCIREIDAANKEIVGSVCK